MQGIIPIPFLTKDLITEFTVTLSYKQTTDTHITAPVPINT